MESALRSLNAHPGRNVDVSPTTPRHRDTVAHLNYFCEQVSFFSEVFVPVRQFQSHLVQALNEDLVKIDGEYVDPREKLRAKFR